MGLRVLEQPEAAPAPAGSAEAEAAADAEAAEAEEAAPELGFPPHPRSRFSIPDLVMASFASTYQQSLRHALRSSHFSFVLTDPNIHDNPIVYASDGFLSITGYSAEEVLGRNCRFLQGPATDRRTVLEIRDAIREERPCQVSILNYTKAGEAFWNLFHMAPVFSREDGRVLHYLGVQTPINPSLLEDGSKAMVQGLKTLPALQGPHDESLPLGSVGDDNRRAHAAVLDEDGCEVTQADKDKARFSVQSLLQELTTKCKGPLGVSDVAYCQPDVERVVCSSLMLSLTKVQQSFVLANPHLPDTPIVHASDVFLQLSGYTREEVVGRNCRFLQGPDTDPRAVQQIRESLTAEKACTVRLLNYRKDKTPFWNLLHIAPVRSSCGKVAFFVGVQLEVSSFCESQSLETNLVPDMKQLGAVGAVKVAIRSLQGEGLRRIHKSG